MSNHPGQVLVVSGGSGYNDLVGATPNAIYVMPVSDNGGSSSEIIRVMGGPSLGDLRSRLIRLAAIAATRHKGRSLLSSPSSTAALHSLLSYRLPTVGSSRAVKQEWMDIIEGRHPLWEGIDAEKRECVRGFLVQFESDVLHRAHRNFNFRGGSIGNFFLAAMQRFFRSIQSAIFLFAAVTEIPTGMPGCEVLPAVNTNNTTTIAAQLADQSILVGQCEISHPPPNRRAPLHNWTGESTRPPTPEMPDTPQARSFAERVGSSAQLPVPPAVASSAALAPSSMDSMDEADWSDEEATVRSDLGGVRGIREARIRRESDAMGNIAFSKEEEEAPALPAPIERLMYVNASRSDVYPTPNPAYILGLQRSRTLVYSCGSLWTSILPCLVLHGIGAAIARSPSLEHKVLLLNSTHDRETHGMTATDFVRVICRAINDVAERYSNERSTKEELGPFAVHELITHVVYVRQGTVPLDADELQSLGIQSVGVDAAPEVGRMPRLTERALSEALELITGGPPERP